MNVETNLNRTIMSLKVASYLSFKDSVCYVIVAC